MQPTLREGDRLVVRYAATPRPGRLAVVRLPPGPNGPRPVAVKRLSHAEAGEWWIERDNPAYGVDSRQIGTLPADDVLAIVLARVWPRPSLLRRALGPDGGDAASRGRR
jgi:hypothetical protein